MDNNCEVFEERIFRPSFAQERLVRINSHQPQVLSLHGASAGNRTNMQLQLESHRPTLWTRLRNRVQVSLTKGIAQVKDIFGFFFKNDNKTTIVGSSRFPDAGSRSQRCSSLETTALRDNNSKTMLSKRIARPVQVDQGGNAAYYDHKGNALTGNRLAKKLFCNLILYENIGNLLRDEMFC